MSTRDSGLIDLFAIHQEEEERVSPPSGPPGAVTYDTSAADDLDIDALAADQQKARKRAKLIGAAIGGMAVLGILIAAITSGGSKEPATGATAAAAPPPPPAMVVPAPVAAPTEAAPAAPTPAPPSTSKTKEYTPASAAAAYAGTRAKKKKSGGAKIGSGIKLQKIQSGGTGG